MFTKPYRDRDQENRDYQNERSRSSRYQQDDVRDENRYENRGRSSRQDNFQDRDNLSEYSDYYDQYSSRESDNYRNYGPSRTSYDGEFGQIGYRSMNRQDRTPDFDSLQQRDYPQRDYQQRGNDLRNNYTSNPPSYFSSGYEPKAYQKGSHFGKGPKNYQRSDEKIKENICDQISADPWIDASEVEVEVSDGEVTLTGSVEDRHTKYRIEDICDSCTGVKDIQNQIRVQKSGSSTSESKSSKSNSNVDDFSQRHKKGKSAA